MSCSQRCGGDSEGYCELCLKSSLHSCCWLLSGAESCTRQTFGLTWRSHSCSQLRCCNTLQDWLQQVRRKVLLLLPQCWSWSAWIVVAEFQRNSVSWSRHRVRKTPRQLDFWSVVKFKVWFTGGELTVDFYSFSWVVSCIKSCCAVLLLRSAFNLVVVNISKYGKISPQILSLSHTSRKCVHLNFYCCYIYNRKLLNFMFVVHRGDWCAWLSLAALPGAAASLLVLAFYKT